STPSLMLISISAKKRTRLPVSMLKIAIGGSPSTEESSVFWPGALERSTSKPKCARMGTTGEAPSAALKGATSRGAVPLRFGRGWGSSCHLMRVGELGSATSTARLGNGKRQESLVLIGLQPGVVLTSIGPDDVLDVVVSVDVALDDSTPPQPARRRAET